jgi:hypothetical protein
LFSKINFILPTYKRSGTKLPEFLNSFLNTAAKPDSVYFTFIVNEDDTDTIDYLRDHSHYRKKLVILPPAGKPHLAQLMNAGFDQTPFKGEEYVYAYIGDDFVSRTERWDMHVLDGANRSGGMRAIWGYDGYLNDLPTYYFMPDRLFQALGTPYWVYPNAGMELTDLITRDMLAPLGRLFHMPHLLLEHKHSSRAEIGADDTFNRLQSADNSKATAADVKEYILKCQTNLKAYMQSIRSSQSSSAPSKSEPTPGPGF